MASGHEFVEFPPCPARVRVGFGMNLSKETMVVLFARLQANGEQHHELRYLLLGPVRSSQNTILRNGLSPRSSQNHPSEWSLGRGMNMSMSMAGVTTMMFELLSDPEHELHSQQGVAA